MSDPQSVAEIIGKSDWLSYYRQKYPTMLGFESLKPKEVPPTPPDLTTFRNLRPHEKEIKGEKFYVITEIKEFLDKKWEVELYNRTGYERCKQLLQEELDKDDVVNRKLVAERLYEFKKAIQAVDKPYIALRVDWSKEPVFEKKEEMGWTE